MSTVIRWGGSLFISSFPVDSEIVLTVFWRIFDNKVLTPIEF